jgi:hypothetical protein
LTAHGYGKWSLAGSILTMDTLLLHGLVINSDLLYKVYQRALTVLLPSEIDKLPSNMWSSQNPVAQLLAKHSVRILKTSCSITRRQTCTCPNGIMVLRNRICLHRNFKGRAEAVTSMARTRALMPATPEFPFGRTGFFITWHITT